jgi:hypothetical protein
VGIRLRITSTRVPGGTAFGLRAARTEARPSRLRLVRPLPGASSRAA